MEYIFRLGKPTISLGDISVARDTHERIYI